MSDTQSIWPPAHDFNLCGRCGRRTYTYGAPCDGQVTPLPGDLGSRERRFRYCPACGWEVDQAPKREPLADYYGVTVPAKDVKEG